MTVQPLTNQEQEYATRRNIAQSRVVVLVAFAVNAGLNVVLLGVLARLGGFDLVGIWALLNAILMTTLIADFGITNALIYHIGRDGIAAVAARLRLLLVGIAGLATLAGLAAAGAGLLGQPWPTAVALVVLAALFQLASNWQIAIRMSQHQQYWFNVKTILRVVLQTGLALLFYAGLETAPELAFAAAIVLAGLAEVAFATLLTWRLWVLRGPLAERLAIAELVRGFGLLGLAQKAMDPLSRMIIAGIAGPTALGVFVSARRVPAVISQAVSDALRALLPGLSRMTGDSNRAAVQRLLQEAVESQIVMIVGPVLLIAIHAELVFIVWLGRSDPALVTSLWFLGAGLIFNNVTIPFFWAAQAFGSAHRLARLNSARVLFTLAIGSCALTLTQSVVAFAAVFALSQVASGALTLMVCARFDGLVGAVFRSVNYTPILGFLVALCLANVAAGALLADLGAAALLGALVIGNLVLAALAARILLRRAKA